MQENAAVQATRACSSNGRLGSPYEQPNAHKRFEGCDALVILHAHRANVQVLLEVTMALPDGPADCPLSSFLPALMADGGGSGTASVADQPMPRTWPTSPGSLASVKFTECTTIRLLHLISPRIQGSEFIGRSSWSISEGSRRVRSLEPPLHI